jgi:uncharacterized alpha-E superfamily protein
VIARVADHCFWFGRYLERTESIARVLSVTTTLALDAELTPRQSWSPVVIVSGSEDPFCERFGEDALANGELVQRFLALDESNPVSLRSSVSAARSNARAIREVVSLEVFEAMNELHVWLQSHGATSDFEQDRFGFYKRVRGGTQLCLGLLRSTMLHDAPLDFIWLGVMLERVSQTARMLDVHHHALVSESARTGQQDSVPASASTEDPSAASAAASIVETALWLSILRGCSGYEPFMKRHPGSVTRRGVAAFLLLEPRFPRSIRYCVQSAHERLQQIRPANAVDLPGAAALARLARLRDELECMTPDDVSRAEIHELLTHIVDEAHAAGEDVSRELLSGHSTGDTRDGN